MSVEYPDVAYEDTNWQTCPVCGDTRIGAEIPDADGDWMNVNVSCVCGAVWVEVYEPVERTNIDPQGDL